MTPRWSKCGTAASTGQRSPPQWPSSSPPLAHNKSNTNNNSVRFQQISCVISLLMMKCFKSSLKPFSWLLSGCGSGPSPLLECGHPTGFDQPDCRSPASPAGGARRSAEWLYTDNWKVIQRTLWSDFSRHHELLGLIQKRFVLFIDCYSVKPYFPTHLYTAHWEQ